MPGQEEHGRGGELGVQFRGADDNVHGAAVPWLQDALHRTFDVSITEVVRTLKFWQVIDLEGPKGNTLDGVFGNPSIIPLT